MDHTEKNVEETIEGIRNMKITNEDDAEKKPVEEIKDSSKIKKQQMSLPLNQIVKAGSSSETGTTSTTAKAADVEAPISGGCQILRHIFKTKRFYESADDNFWMSVFSQTIRSTTPTPTEDIEMSEVVGIVDLGSAGTSSVSTGLINSSMNISPASSNYQQTEFLSLQEDVASTADHSSAESHTDNFEMYNEPNLQSLVDNITEELFSLPYMAEVLPHDNTPTPKSVLSSSSTQPTSELVSTPSIILECFNDDLVKVDEVVLETSHGHYSPPLSKQMQIPRRPLEGVSFFHITIEEEDVYDADVESEGGPNGKVLNKSTNTELPFNCKNIKPIGEAAGIKGIVRSEPGDPISDEDCSSVREKSESAQTDCFETAQTASEVESEDMFHTPQSERKFHIPQSQDESDPLHKPQPEPKPEHEFEQDLESEPDSEEKLVKGEANVLDDEINMHASTSAAVQQRSELESRTTVTKKVTTQRMVSSISTLSTSSPFTTSLSATSTASTALADVVALEGHMAATSTRDAAAASSKPDKSYKKKSSIQLTKERKNKSKKSKKSNNEKENINMKQIYLMAQPPVNWRPKEQQNRTVTINRDVSVKHLCRSFGDLTLIDGPNNNLPEGTTLKRAKSVGDVCKTDLARPIQTGVSVKVLRDSYCSLIDSESIARVHKSARSRKKSSFSKFEALQKKNILRVRSSDAGKAQEKFNDANVELEKNCRSCGKVVYKMEEIKAEKNIWHKNCFRCKECSKQLNVDTYQSHESLLYCKPHFKLLFAPKAVEDNEPLKPRKPELIIRENQPVELPPDVARASDKPDLGLEELQQLNVKSRFQVFENYQTDQKTAASLDRSPSGIKKSASILSKLAKFQAKGMNTGVSDDALNDVPYEESSSEDDDEDIPDGEDADLIRAKRAQRERPMSFSNMNDIKTIFETGHIMTKEERREECKQEIKNIRSRLFMGKQAKFKEMYQQAVAESEQGITSAGKKPEIEIGDMAKTLKEKFEKGEIFNREDDETDSTNHKVQDEEMAVFEQGIGKRSRSIFMELDASALKSPQTVMTMLVPVHRTPDAKKHCQVSPLQSDKLKPFTNENVVKCDEKPDDIKIETSEISSKFKFFETYNPNENKHRKEFRITPPRDGVVEIPSPDREIYVDPNVVRAEEATDDPAVAEKSHTTTKMLNVFRQMEQNKFQDHEAGPKPLKRFTPPPDGNRRIYADESEEELSGSVDEEEECGEEEDSDAENRPTRYDDEVLKQAQSAARAKQLREKFEKWEANEIRLELTNGTVDLCDSVESDEGQIETIKSLRAKFEQMKESPNQSPRPRVQVNRFV